MPVPAGMGPNFIALKFTGHLLGSSTTSSPENHLNTALKIDVAYIHVQRYYGYQCPMPHGRPRVRMAFLSDL
jgi:hypothetical protein